MSWVGFRDQAESANSGRKVTDLVQVTYLLDQAMTAEQESQNTRIVKRERERERESDTE